jgi:peptidyl-tRNA hydrolase, PTH1 family
MKLIVGLGNPGDKYKNNRHNAGFLAVDFILKYNDKFIEAKPSHDFKSEMQILGNGQDRVIFMKPQTYMNDSGQALKVICNFYKMDLAKDLLVVHDEVDLPFGTIRKTEDSSSAGHNGIKSIIENIGTQNFQRLRIGVETRASREEMPTDAFVLQDFSEEELKKLNDAIFPQVKKEVEKFINS